MKRFRAPSAFINRSGACRLPPLEPSLHKHFQLQQARFLRTRNRRPPTLSCDSHYPQQSHYPAATFDSGVVQPSPSPLALRPAVDGDDGTSTTSRIVPDRSPTSSSSCRSSSFDDIIVSVALPSELKPSAFLQELLPDSGEEEGNSNMEQKAARTSGDDDGGGENENSNDIFHDRTNSNLQTSTPVAAAAATKNATTTSALIREAPTFRNAWQQLYRALFTAKNEAARRRLLQEDARLLSIANSRAEVEHLLLLLPSTVRAKILANELFHLDEVEEIFVHVGQPVEVRGCFSGKGVKKKSKQQQQQLLNGVEPQQGVQERELITTAAKKKKPGSNGPIKLSTTSSSSSSCTTSSIEYGGIQNCSPSSLTTSFTTSSSRSKSQSVTIQLRDPITIEEFSTIHTSILNCKNATNTAPTGPRTPPPSGSSHSSNSGGRISLPGTLHRLSGLYNRHGTLIGLSMRVGRFLPNIAAALLPYLFYNSTSSSSSSSSVITSSTGSLSRSLSSSSSGSMLLVSPPAVGKTTLLRDLAVQLSLRPGLPRVVVVDTTNELTGDSDLEPLPCFGRVRRLHVPTRSMQAEKLIEAVLNLSPEYIVLDEIANAEEASAVLAIAQRGVHVIAAVHGHSLASIVNNRALNAVVGGTAYSFLSNEERKERQKKTRTVVERVHSSPFQTVVEFNQEIRSPSGSFVVYTDVNAAVDILLRGGDPLSSCEKVAEIVGSDPAPSRQTSAMFSAAHLQQSANSSTAMTAAPNNNNQNRTHTTSHQRASAAAAVGGRGPKIVTVDDDDIDDDFGYTVLGDDGSPSSSLPL